jgi:ferrous iron transport protein A
VSGGNAGTDADLLPLDRAPRGVPLKVAKIKGRGAAQARIMEMGLTPGCEITVTRVAPLGDPIEIKVRGYRLSLRKADVESIEVARLPAATAESAPAAAAATATAAAAAAPAAAAAAAARPAAHHK